MGHKLKKRAKAKEIIEEEMATILLREYM